MAEGFEHLSYSSGEVVTEDLVFRSRPGADDGQTPTNEEIARYYLDLAMSEDTTHPVFRSMGLAADSIPLPTLQHIGDLSSPFDSNTIVRFRQSHRDVPVYGSNAIVELMEGQALSRLDIEIATLDEVDDDLDGILDAAIAALRLSESLSLLRGEPPPEPTLVYLWERQRGGLALCYLFSSVSLDAVEEGRRRRDAPVAGWEGARERLSLWDIFVDAHTGEVVQQLSTSHGVGGAVNIVECTGEDETGVVRDFFGSQVEGGFEMTDEARKFLATYDYQLRAYEHPDPPLARSASNPTTAWDASNKAAVTAHYHAERVYDFFEQVLHRQGVDGTGSPIVSVVNCADASGSAVWENAQWTGSRMIYGQTLVGTELVTLAKYLDVIAHELTHGVTHHTAKLDYQDESGALNESMSDIMGIIASNWAANILDPSSQAWAWEIGAGFVNGHPLRDMRDPAVGSPPQPVHMNDWLATTNDFGGVHTNSGIHNKAAFNVLTARLDDGSLAFTPTEVASFYYFVLLELSHNAGFSDVRSKLAELVRHRKQGNPECAVMVQKIHNAYDAVGIL